MLGGVPAGVRTTTLDQSGNFLNIPRKAPGMLDLSARKDHNILNTTGSAFNGGPGSQAVAH